MSNLFNRCAACQIPIDHISLTVRRLACQRDMLALLSEGDLSASISAQTVDFILGSPSNYGF